MIQQISIGGTTGDLIVGSIGGNTSAVAWIETSYIKIPAVPTYASSADSSLAPKYIGTIVAGTVGFILVICVAAWAIRRHINKINRASIVKQDDAFNGKPELPAGQEVADYPEVVPFTPGLFEVHGDHLTEMPNGPGLELWDPRSQNNNDLSHRWELTGSYDAHGTSELDVSNTVSRTDGGHMAPPREYGWQKVFRGKEGSGCYLY